MHIIKKKEFGQAMMEFAVVLPTMILLLFGSLDLYSLINARSQLIQCAGATADYITTNFTVPLETETETDASDASETTADTDTSNADSSSSISYTKEEVESKAEAFAEAQSIDGIKPKITEFKYINDDTGVIITMQCEVSYFTGVLKIATGKSTAVLQTNATASIRLSN